LLEKRVRIVTLMTEIELILPSPVTDMLVAVLNTCTKEELEEVDEDLAILSPTAASAESAERRKIIKNKIMAVGRMARVFALLRYVTSSCRYCRLCYSSILQ